MISRAVAQRDRRQAVTAAPESGSDAPTRTRTEEKRFLADQPVLHSDSASVRRHRRIFGGCLWRSGGRISFSAAAPGSHLNPCHPRPVTTDPEGSLIFRPRIKGWTPGFEATLGVRRRILSPKPRSKPPTTEKDPTIPGQGGNET